IKGAMVAMYRLQMDGKLPKDKQAALVKLEAFQKTLPDNLKSLQEEKAQLEVKLSAIREACIIAEVLAYPGVRVAFGIVYRDIQQERPKCKFDLEGCQVVMSEFHGD
ncbi:MAG: FapA family protein, partial [candidate division Zixibacteria bacterium]|nr:FapA family protein [candidate division Zixibacteria bacterium]